MNLQQLKLEIEDLRSELTNEYEKYIDKDGINQKVMELSQRMDQLILEYLKISKPK